MEKGYKKRDRKAEMKTALIRNITEYLERHPGASANVMASEISQMPGMKAQAITTRKLGYLIPRLVDVVTRQEKGVRAYYLPGDAPEEEVALEEKLD